MTLVRRIARPMLAAVFVSGGVDALRNPGPRIAAAEKVGPTIARRLPYLPQDTTQLVRINAGVMVGAGSMLAMGKAPRLASLALAGSLVPTTLAGHRFWEVEDKAERAKQRTQFLKNLGLVGGLVLAAVDTEGRPGVAWRARRVTRDARRATHVVAHDAKLQTRLAGARARQHVA